jgi:DNA-binding XRE family transcriptional regulator
MKVKNTNVNKSHICAIRSLSVVLTSGRIQRRMRFISNGGAQVESFSRAKLYAQVGARIRKAREAKLPKMTQSDLATLLGVERTSITNIESGTQRATLLLLYGVAEKLGEPLGTLLPDVDDPSIREGTHTPIAEITVGKRKRTVPVAIKSVFDKV